MPSAFHRRDARREPWVRIRGVGPLRVGPLRVPLQRFQPAPCDSTQSDFRRVRRIRDGPVGTRKRSDGAFKTPRRPVDRYQGATDGRARTNDARSQESLGGRRSGTPAASGRDGGRGRRGTPAPANGSPPIHAIRAARSRRSASSLSGKATGYISSLSIRAAWKDGLTKPKSPRLQADLVPGRYLSLTSASSRWTWLTLFLTPYFRDHSPVISELNRPCRCLVRITAWPPTDTNERAGSGLKNRSDDGT